MIKIVRALVWTMMSISSLISVITIVVTSGMIDYNSQLKLFTNLMLLEISLSITLLLWAIDSLFNNYAKGGKKSFVCYAIMSMVFLLFIINGVY